MTDRINVTISGLTGVGKTFVVDALRKALHAQGLVCKIQSPSWGELPLSDRDVLLMCDRLIDRGTEIVITELNEAGPI